MAAKFTWPIRQQAWWPIVQWDWLKSVIPECTETGSAANVEAANPALPGWTAMIALGPSNQAEAQPLMAGERHRLHAA